MAVNIKVTVSWNIMLSSATSRYQGFRRTWWQRQHSNQNVDICLPPYIASHPRRL